MILSVTPDKYNQLLDLNDRASMTLDGHFDESTWLSGLRSMFPELPLSSLIIDREPIHVVVQYDGD